MLLQGYDTTSCSAPAALTPDRLFLGEIFTEATRNSPVSMTIDLDKHDEERASV